MWLRRGSYLCRMLDFLGQSRVLESAEHCTVLKQPTERASQLCQAHVANVASGILESLPSFRSSLPRRTLHVSAWASSHHQYYCESC